MSSPGSNSRFATYRNALNAISARTGTPLPALVVSFGVLHELTAIVPLVGVFYGARAFGIGERVVNAVVQDGSTTSYEINATKLDKTDGWLREKCKTWVDDGEKWASRVGKRYGVFGFEKRVAGQQQPPGFEEENAVSMKIPGHIAGDAANAVFAYGVTKALIPLRIGLSLYLSPAFARRVVEPLRKTVMWPFRSRR